VDNLHEVEEQAAVIIHEAEDEAAKIIVDAESEVDAAEG